MSACLIFQNCKDTKVYRQRGQCPSTKYTSIFSEKENTVPWWAFKLNSALGAAENWHFKDSMLKVKQACITFSCTQKHNSRYGVCVRVRAHARVGVCVCANRHNKTNKW
jgi:hypothetical protein